MLNRSRTVPEGCRLITGIIITAIESDGMNSQTEMLFCTREVGTHFSHPIFVFNETRKRVSSAAL